MKAITKTLTINNRSVSIQGTVESFEDCTDALLTFEVNGQLFKNIRFQEEETGEGYTIGHETQLNEEARYQALFSALTDNAESAIEEIEENCDRYDFALSTLPGWKQVQDLANECITSFA